MSGRKNVIRPYPWAIAQSLGASFQSSSVNIQFLDRVAISLICTATAGSAVGVFTLQGRVSPSVQNSQLPNPPGPAGEWTDLDLDAMPLNSADKNIVIDVITTGLVEVRISYVRTSGTGSCDIWIAAKEAG